MTLLDILKSAWTNLRRRPARTMLTSVGVAVGALTIVAMVSLGIGVQRAISAQFDEIGLQNLQVAPREPERPPRLIGARDQRRALGRVEQGVIGRGRVGRAGVVDQLADQTPLVVDGHRGHRRGLARYG